MAGELKKISTKVADFPQDFLWGASISPHQVEGNMLNQWSAWEAKRADYLSNNAERLIGWIPVWREVAKEATNTENYISGNGVEHYERYKTDFHLARSIGLNGLRSGIEWSRVNPQQGIADMAALKHYSRYFREMHGAGLKPVVNLFHWSIPQWFAELGGFKHRRNLKYWTDYVHSIVESLDFSHIDYVITINEANVYSSLGYFDGAFPPGEHSMVNTYRVYRNLARAHRIAYDIIKARYPHIQVGVAHQCNKVVGLSLVGSLVARAQAWWWNWSWLNWARQHDFVGFNYYFTDYRKGLSILPDANPPEPKNDLGWYMEPAGIKDVIIDCARRWPNTPILITENGVADMHDTHREWWISETIQAIKEARDEGAHVIGYLHWSLLDNFEWQYGWFPKFGLFKVDHDTMKRTEKASTKAWSAWLKTTRQ